MLAARALAVCATLGLLGCASTLEQARAARGRQELDAAEALYRRALEDGEDPELARMELVELLRARAAAVRDPREAIRGYEQVLALDPIDEAALRGAARAWARLGHHDRALSMLGAAEDQGCTGCRKLRAWVLVERGNVHLGDRRLAAADADFSAALILAPDLELALAVAETRIARGQLAEATAALLDTVPSLSADRDALVRRFEGLRRTLLGRLALEGRFDLADRLVSAAVPGGSSITAELAAELAEALARRGDPSGALVRYEGVLAARNENTWRVDDALAGRVRRRLFDLYLDRAIRSASAEDLVAARRDLDRCGELGPDDPRLEPQRLLLAGASGGLDQALAAVGRMPIDRAGRREVEAVLLSRRIAVLVAGGLVEPAQTVLEQARQLAPDAPEVHVAAARVLARLEVEDLADRDVREAVRAGWVRDGSARIHRYGEALSELDWARQQIRAQGPSYPFRDPGLVRVLDELVRDIARSYPFEVRFRDQPDAAIVLHNGADRPITVRLEQASGPGEVTVAAGARTPVVVAPGLIRLRTGTALRLFVAEPYTEVALSL